MIEVENVYVNYGAKTILQGVTTCFPKGKITGIMGPNGCGKSTLLKTITGLCKPTQGQVRINEMPLKDLSSKKIAQQVAYLPQSRSIPSLTVERMVLHGRFAYLSYPRRYGKEDYEAVEQALHLVDADSLIGKNVSDLSGGQRQKVYIAMALAQDTETILMDEPTTYLDIRNQIETLILARKLADLGKSIVLVLHDLDSVMRYADHVILMREGRIAVQGTPVEVYKSGEIENSFGISLQCIQTEQGQYYIPTMEV